MKEFPLSKVFQIIEPGPVVLVTTGNRKKANIMTMSWHMMMDFEPPLIGCIVSTCNHSFHALRATKECVIAVPTVDMATVVVDVGNCSGQEVDKFKSFGLTPLPAQKVKAPLIGRTIHANGDGTFVIDGRSLDLKKRMVKWPSFV
jgi:flavin reductase (DIM6/NTAB) family NADH-FMN oxidoreductase RutF